MKDLIILGNGMAGMTAALYAARAGLDFKLVGRDEYDFGQIGNAILVENYPCAPTQSGMDLAMRLHNQLEQYGIQVEEHEIKTVSNLPDKNFLIEYTDGTTDYAKTVIYALGAQHKKLNCRIEDDIPIHYCALCDGSFYKDKHVAVIGGGDSAFTQAEYLAKICKTVYIIMCDENITANRITADRVKSLENIKIVYNYPVDSISHYRTFSKDKKYWVRSKKYDCGFIFDGVFVAIGMIPNVEPLIIPYMLDILGYIIADENGITCCEGFYAAGDVRYKKVRQGITAAADGANAVQSVINYLANIKDKEE